MIKFPELTEKIKHSSHAHLVHSTKKYFRRIFTRILNWKNYPDSYFNLYEEEGKLTLHHYEHNSLIHSQTVHLENVDSFEHVLKNPHLPIYFVLQGHNCEFRTFITKQIKIWDRFLLFSQLKNNEFHPNDLIQSYCPKKYLEKIDVLIAVRSNDFLKKVYEILRSFTNPIGGVILWDIEQGFAMKKQAKTVKTLQQWIVTLVPITNHKFTMLVFCQEALLLQRTIYSKSTNEIEKEIQSTLRFLQRQGYKDNMPVSIVACEDSIDITKFSHDKFETVAVTKRLFEKESYRPTSSLFNFLPQSLKQANLAYALPKLAIKFLVPLCVLLLMIWSIVQIKSFFQDYEAKWVNSNYEEIAKRTRNDYFEQAALGKLFTNYLSTAANNPSHLVDNINKVLKGKFMPTSITWSQKEPFHELRLNFTNPKSKNLKKHIQNLEKALGTAKINLDEHENESTLLLQMQPTTNKKVMKNEH